MPEMFEKKISPSFYFDFSVASEKATKAVVHIKSSLEKSKQENSRMEFNPFDFDPFGGGWGFFDMPRQPSSGMGSGVIISDNGYIITNSHVVSSTTAACLLKWIIFLRVCHYPFFSQLPGE